MAFAISVETVVWLEDPSCIVLHLFVSCLLVEELRQMVIAFHVQTSVRKGNDPRCGDFRNVIIIPGSNLGHLSWSLAQYARSDWAMVLFSLSTRPLVLGW